MDRRYFLRSSGAAAAVAWLHRAARASDGALPARFTPVHDVLAQEVAQQHIPGGVWLVAHGDDVTVDTVGMSAIGSTTRMRRDTIFRIASMTKGITATAVMMLVEEKKLALDAPVARWLPELANPKVLKRMNGPIDDVEPARRAITVHDLLAFTFGSGLVFDPTLPIQKAIDAQQLVTAQPVPMTPHGPDEWMRRFGSLPLMHQPGARWMYNTGSLIQGVLIRRAAKQDFDTFVTERILAPLGMRDSGFFCPAAKLNRFAGCGVYTDAQSGKAMRMDADGAQSAYATRPVFPSGAGGMVSTVDDYLSFARMLMNRGTYGSKRLLSEASVKAMTTDHLSAEQKAASDFFPHFFDTNGWGYGMAVVTQPDAVSQTPGRYGWDGGFGTSWSSDPTRKLISVVMTQSADFLFNGARDAFWKAVYAK
jgi:CubicO group peptidase (beta-lactamase class C family)